MSTLMTTLQRDHDETTGDAGQPVETVTSTGSESAPEASVKPVKPVKQVGASAPTDAVDLLSRIVAERPNGEVRPQQEHMVRLVEDAIKNNTHLLVQAGTGTGKSLGYLIPAIMQAKKHDKRIVVSTATKQLGEQIVTEDMPVLAATIPKVGGDDFTYALIKGRQNYLCRKEVDSLLRLDDEAGGGEQEGLFEDPTPRENSRRPSADDLKKLNSLLQWADTTQTGDRTDAPAVPDKVWDQVSTDAAGCAGKACPFYDECFAEFARATAREADVVVTNHAQVAQDLQSEFPLLGEWDVLVTDEVHELESYLSSAWGLEVAPSAMRHHIAQAARKLPRGDRTDYSQARDEAVKVIEDLDALSEALGDAPEGLMPEMPHNIGNLLVTIATRLRVMIQAFKLSSEEGGIGQNVSADRKGAGQKMTHLALAIAEMCEDMSDGTRVRWLEPGFGNRSPVLKVAPLWIGPKLMTLLDSRTLIATSATMTVGGTFDSFIRTLALTEPITTIDGETRQPRKFAAVDVGTPFNYDQQAVLYIPTLDFPAPVGQDRFAHTEAVLEEVTSLAKAAGGRTLALFTTRKGAENAAFHLRANLDTPVLCQGDAPPSQLIEEFKNDEHATLCATMGFWHGVNAPGSTLSLVITDKVPFPRMDDPLMSARKDAVDRDRRGQGFNEVYVAAASVMLSQGVGRLIRTATDKGVVAVLDTRLMTKGYGRTMRESLPQMRVLRDRSVVEAALGRLAAAADAAMDAPSATTSAYLKAKSGSGSSGGTGRSGEPVPHVPARKAAPRKASTRALARNTKSA